MLFFVSACWKDKGVEDVAQGHKLTGTITGTSQASVTLSLAGSYHSFTTTSDATGAFQFSGVATDSYTLTPSLKGYAFVPSSMVLIIGAGDIKIPNIVAIPSSATYIVGGSIKGVPVSEVLLTLSASAQNASVLSLASGEFSFSGVTNGRYTLRPSKSGYTFTPEYITVDVPADKTTGLVFTASPEQHTVSGTISGGVKVGVSMSLTGAKNYPAVTSDANGNFTIPAVVPGRYTLTPSLSGFTFFPANITVEVAGEDVPKQNFYASQNPNAAYTVSGLVYGAVQAGVAVSLTGPKNYGPVTTDANGNFSLNGVSPGTYSLSASLSGFTFIPENSTIEVTSSDVTGNKFYATRIQNNSFSVSGVVFGETHAGVSFTLTGPQNYPSVTTDGNGAFSFTGVVPGRYTLTPTLAGYVFSPMSTTVEVTNGNVVGQNFTSTRAPPPSFTVSGTITGAVQAGVTLSLTGQQSYSPVTSDSNGNFSIVGVMPGNYTLTATLAGYNFNPVNTVVEVTNSNVTSKNFIATQSQLPTYSVSGIVSGLLQGAAKLTLSGAKQYPPVMTDANGNFSINGVSPGSYTLTPELSGHTFNPLSHSVEVMSSNVSGKNFSVVQAQAATFTVSGLVYGDVSADVTVSLSGSKNYPSVTTDTNGNFRFFGVEPGTYTLTPSRAGFTFNPANTSVEVTNTDISGRYFYASKPAPTTFAISGLVYGAIQSDVTISISGPNSYPSVTTDSSGSFRIANVSPGTYTVTPSRVGYVFNPTSSSVTLSSSDVPGTNFYAAPVSTATYAVSGTISGTSRAGVTLSLTGDKTYSPVTSDSSGSFRFSGVAPGNYTLTPSRSGSSFDPSSRSLAVTSGDVSSQDFRIVESTTPTPSPALTCSGEWCWQSPHPNMFSTINDVYGFSSNDVWSVGREGRVLHFAPPASGGNASWTLESLNTLQLFTAIWGAGPTDIWMGGDQTTFYYYDSSRQWRKITTNLPGGETIHGIWGTSSTDVWAVGTNGFFAHCGPPASQGAPCTWSKVTVPSATGRLQDIWGTSATDIWASGDPPSQFYHCGPPASGNAPCTWSEVPHNAGDGVSIYSIRGFSQSDIWAVGVGKSGSNYVGMILKCSPPGSNGVPCTWSRQTIPDGDYLFSMWGTASNDLWACGQNNRLLRLTPSQPSWQNYPNPPPTNTSSSSIVACSSIWGTSSSNFWMIGMPGPLLHR